MIYIHVAVSDSLTDFLRTIRQNIYISHGPFLCYLHRKEDSLLQSVNTVHRLERAEVTV